MFETLVVGRPMWRVGASCSALLVMVIAGSPGVASASSTLLASAAHGGHVYELREAASPLTWDQASLEAQVLGAHLATVGSAAENEVLATLVDTAVANGDVCEGTRLLHWIGLNDVIVEGTWQWVNGDNFSYDNWNAGEPNDFGTGEDHVVMVCPNTPDLRGKWNDTGIDHPNAYTFLCEYPPLPELWFPAGLRVGDVLAVALDPSDSAVAYLGTAQGVFKSSDHAATWTHSSSGLGHPEVTDLAVDPLTPSTVYAGTNGHGVFKSTDSGVSWTAANTGLTSTEIDEIDIDPVTPTRIYLETGGGVFRSTNGGASWSPLVNAPCAEVAIDPQQPWVLHSGCVAQHWMSSNWGDTWTVAAANLFWNNKREWAVDPGNSDTVLFTGTDTSGITCWDEEVVRRGSGGFFTEELSNLCGPAFTSVRFAAPGLVYAGDRTRLFSSSDGGDTWSAPMEWQDGFFTGNRVHDLAADSTRVLAGTAMGLMRSTDQGGSWSWPEVEVEATATVAWIAGAPQGAPLFVIADNVVYRSSDHGESWTPVLAGSQDTTEANMAVDHTDPTKVYVVFVGIDRFSNFYYSWLMRSTDGGSTWTRIYNPTATQFLTWVKLLVDPDTPSTLYLATWEWALGNQVYESLDSGSTWTLASTLPGTGVVSDLLVDPDDPTVFYAITSDPAGALYKSTDSASSWTLVTSGLPGTEITAIAIDPTSPQTLYAAAEGGDVHRSSDGAASWSPARSGLPPLEVRALAVDPNDSLQVFSATEGGVYHSFDSGQSWRATSGELNAFSLAVTARLAAPRVWAGTIDGGLHSLDPAMFADGFESGNSSAW